MLLTRWPNAFGSTRRMPTGRDPMAANFQRDGVVTQMQRGDGRSATPTRRASEGERFTAFRHEESRVSDRPRWRVGLASFPSTTRINSSCFADREPRQSAMRALCAAVRAGSRTSATADADALRRRVVRPHSVPAIRSTPVIGGIHRTIADREQLAIWQVFEVIGSRLQPVEHHGLHGTRRPPGFGLSTRGQFIRHGQFQDLRHLWHSARGLSERPSCYRRSLEFGMTFHKPSQTSA